MCEQMKHKGIAYYSHPYSNIITIKANCMDKEVAKRFGLVPDNHNNPKWYKIVLMEHVTIEKLIPLLQELRACEDVVLSS